MLGKPRPNKSNRWETGDGSRYLSIFPIKVKKSEDMSSSRQNLRCHLDPRRPLGGLGIMVWDISHANAGSFRWYDIRTHSFLERRKAAGTVETFARAAVRNRASLRRVCIPQVRHQMRQAYCALDQSLRSLCLSFCCDIEYHVYAPFTILSLVTIRLCRMLSLDVQICQGIVETGEVFLNSMTAERTESGIVRGPSQV